jgi:hypothetical protein
MPVKYGPDVIKFCLDLYLRFNGQSFDRIEKEMRKQWPNWSRQNLVTRGQKIGWIEQYGWEKALEIKIASAESIALTESEVLFKEICDQRRRIKGWLDSAGVADKDLTYQHRDYCKLTIEALNKIEASRDNLEAFTAMWERLMDWLHDIDPKAEKVLLGVSDAVIERAKAEYGDKESDSDDSVQD